MHSKMLFAVATVIHKILSFVYDDDIDKISIGHDGTEFWSINNDDEDEVVSEQ